MKNFLVGAFAVVFFSAIMGYGILVAYPNEQCGRIESWFKEKQENPEMYPGLQLTASLKESCPSIESNLAPVISQSSTNVGSEHRDIWEEIQDFQTQSQLRALEAENGSASQ